MNVLFFREDRGAHRHWFAIVAEDYDRPSVPMRAAIYMECTGVVFICRAKVDTAVLTLITEDEVVRERLGGASDLGTFLDAAAKYLPAMVGLSP